ncbi:ribonuclease H-like protein [Auricularia subglabra TFB-10046 SS5]|nr:ribonuclease H-like protein [Auricularia subglabra TFB-10046 SS5]
MPKAPQLIYYAVAKGKHAHSPGIYTDWNETAAHVLNCHSKCHKFLTLPEAYQFLSDNHVDLSTIAGPSATPTGSSSTTRAASPAPSRSAFPTLQARAPSTTSAGTVSETTGRQEDTEASADEEHLWDILYTDGACSNNGNGAMALAGIGVWQSFAINCVYTYIPEWQKNGWKKRSAKAAKNQELLEYLAALLEMHDLLGHRVRLQRVRGHSGKAGNEAADALARAGALLPPRDEGDWAAKLQVQDLTDGDSIPGRGNPRSLDALAKGQTLMRSAQEQNTSPCGLTGGEEDEFSGDDDDFMDGIDEDELARLDVPLPEQPAGVQAFLDALDVLRPNPHV